MRRNLLILAAAALALAGGFWLRSEPKEWAEGIPKLTRWDEAIERCRDESRLLLIYNGWHPSTPCLACTQLKRALGVLAAGEGEYAPYRKLFRERFALLSVETRTEIEEVSRRGPEGPFGFFAHNVPVLVIKDPAGKTLLHRVGFLGGGDEGPDLLASWIDTALRRHEQPEGASWESLAQSLYGEALHLEEVERIDDALEVHQELGALPSAAPQVASLLALSKHRLSVIAARARRELEELHREGAESTELHEALTRLLAKYGRLPGFREEVERLRLERARG